jgi:WD40 repeat protein
MRKSDLAAFLLLCASTATVASQTIAKMQLPCESPFQVLSPIGTQLAVQCKGNSLHLIDVPEGTQQSSIPAERGVNTFVYSPDGRWLAVGFTDGTVDVIPVRDKAPSKHWKAGSHRIDTLYFFPDSKTIFVGPVDSPGMVWDTANTPTLRATLPGDFGGMPVCAVSPDGKLLVAAGDDTVVRWYDTATWQKTREYRGFLLETFALKFTQDAKQLLAGGADSHITVLDVASAKEVRQLPPEAGSYIGEIDILGDKQGAVTVYFDNAGEKPPHVLLWDLTTTKSIAVKSDPPATCGNVVDGKLWMCTADGKTLTISQHQY